MPIRRIASRVGRRVLKTKKAVGKKAPKKKTVSLTKRVGKSVKKHSRKALKKTGKTLKKAASSKWGKRAIYGTAGVGIGYGSGKALIGSYRAGYKRGKRERY